MPKSLCNLPEVQLFHAAPEVEIGKKRRGQGTQCQLLDTDMAWLHGRAPDVLPNVLSGKGLFSSSQIQERITLVLPSPYLYIQ